jgi:hypothetical protein
MESSFKIRQFSPADYSAIIAVLDEWWAGRQMRARGASFTICQAFESE